MLTGIDPKDWPSRKKVHKLVKRVARKAEAERLACRKTVRRSLQGAAAAAVWLARNPRSTTPLQVEISARRIALWSRCASCGRCSRDSITRLP